MSVFDLYSKRRKRELGDVIDVYTYDAIPSTFRVQLVHILDDAIGDSSAYNERYSHDVLGAYKIIVKTLRREYGVFETHNYSNGNYRKELMGFILNETDADRIIDAIELSYKVIEKICARWSQKHREASIAAAKEINHRLKEHGLGYQLTDLVIIRTDSEITHQNITLPTLIFLQEDGFSGAREEYLSAFDHFRSGSNKECLNDCLKAFESTMKAVCDIRSWEYEKTATAKKLIAILISKNLLPSFWQTNFNSLENLLSASVPTGRNKLGGHGQGGTPILVPDEIVEYMLNMTGSTILFIAKCNENYQQEDAII